MHDEPIIRGETVVTLAKITLSEAGLAGLRAKVNKLNKRADRHGMNKLDVRVLQEFTVPNKGRDDYRYQVEINGCAPCINGWHLAARVENNSIVGTIVHVVPGKFDDCDYSECRETDYFCDHCKSRRYRKDVFVLKSDNGSTKTVGRNCLADYIRSENAEDFARYAEFCEQAAKWNDDELSDYAYGDGFGSGAGCPFVAIDRFLTTTATCIRRLGWTSRTDAKDDYGRTATASDACYLLFGRQDSHYKEFVHRNELYTSDGDKDLAAKALEWAQSVEPNKSEYLNTIRSIAIAGGTDYKLAGYAASIIRAYQRECERIEERAKNVKRKDYIGFAGERLRDLLVTVKRVRYFEGNYGTKTIVAMEAKIDDETVAPIVWFASGSLEFDEGADYTLTGTIKKHDENDYGKQTIVNRCKLNSK